MMTRKLMPRFIAVSKIRMVKEELNKIVMNSIILYISKNHLSYYPNIKMTSPFVIFEMT